MSSILTIMGVLTLAGLLWWVLTIVRFVRYMATKERITGEDILWCLFIFFAPLVGALCWYAIGKPVQPQRQD